MGTCPFPYIIISNNNYEKNTINSRKIFDFNIFVLKKYILLPEPSLNFQ